jgi:hypothetical protein
VRDGRDVAASHLRSVPEWGYASVCETAYNWQNLLKAARLRAPHGRYLEVKYEDLVAAPRQTCEGMREFLDLPFDDNMLRHHRAQHSLHANSWGHPAADATQKALNKSAIGRYRADLSASQVRAFEQAAASALQEHGYT